MSDWRLSHQSPSSISVVSVPSLPETPSMSFSMRRGASPSAAAASGRL